MFLSIPIAAKKEKIVLHGNNLEKKYNVLNFCITVLINLSTRGTINDNYTYSTIW